MLRTQLCLFLLSLNLKLFPSFFTSQQKELFLGGETLLSGRKTLCELDSGKFKSKNINKDFRIFVLHEYDKKSAVYKDPIAYEDEIKFIINSYELITRNAWEKVILEVSLTKEDNCYCLLYTSPSPRDRTRSRMPSSA